MAAYLSSQNWPGTVEIYDGRLSGKIRKQETGETFFGDTDSEMLNAIRSINPDIVGISNMFTNQVSRAFRLAELAKQACPDVTVVFGGPHASSFPLEVLEKDYVDYVVMGEGEERLYHLLNCIENGEEPEIQGVLGKPEDQNLLRPNKKAPIRFIEKLDELPIPAYDRVDMERYFDLQGRGYSPRLREWGKRAVTILTSRGCPHQCIFCSIQATMGYRWRHHSPEYVKRHIEHLREQHDIDFIHFEDDNFTHDPERYDQIIDNLLKLEPHIRWDTPNGVRGDTWTLDRVKRTKEAGCQFLNVAIESGVQSVLTNIVKKRLDLSDVKNLMAYCQDVGLRLNAFYIIGFPGETLDEVRSTVEFSLERYSRFGVYPMLQPLIPLPGTEVWDTVTEHHLYDGQFECKYNQIHTEHFTPEDISRIYREFSRRKIGTFIKRTLTSWRDFIFNLKLVFSYREAVVRTFRNAAFGE